MYSVESHAVTDAVEFAARPGGVYRYTAYGLGILSELPLPEFSEAPPEHPCGDVFVTLSREDDGREEEWIDTVRGERSFWSVAPGHARFWFQGVGGFRVVDGREVIVSPEPGIESSLLRLYVEGMMMASLLYQRGFYVLHASVVQIDGYAIAFLGHVGAGKSSVAAALHARGHAVVTDDNAALNLSGQRPLVTPAFPAVKVFPSIAVALGYPEESLEVMHASQIKRAHSVNRAFPERPVPLRRIYVLTREDAAREARLSPPEYMMELIRNSVPTRWRQPGDAAHLRQCAQLVSMIPAWRIRTFDTLEDLPQLARRIEEHDLEAARACV